MNNPVVSLCLPTNGVAEWVFPVLDSIYNQGCDNNEFEIILTDNGKNEDFKDRIKEYNLLHENLHYFETDALPFINEIESYKRANGKLIKFVNHRTLLVDGALNKLINIVIENYETKPIIYFTNGVLQKDKRIYEYHTFDEFVNNLSYWSSWSTGMTIWKSDFEKLPKDIQNFNELFPHTNILFNEKDRKKYIIDNTVIFNEMPQGKKPKGDYNLFYAFGVEFPAVLLELYRKNSISVNTFKNVLDANLEFIANLYFIYFIKKEYCSYNLDGLYDMFGIFYSRKELRKKIFKCCLKKICRKSMKIINRKNDE